MDDKLVYEEIGRNYRYFLDWRNKIVGGYIAVLGAFGFAFSGAKTPEIRIVILFAAIPLSIVFWIFDTRNRDLFWACQRAGAGIEGNIIGTYASLEALRVQTPKLNRGNLLANRLTHGLGINILVSSVLAVSCGGLALQLPVVWDIRELAIPLTVAFVIFVASVIAYEKIGDAQRHKQGEVMLKAALTTVKHHAVQS